MTKSTKIVLTAGISIVVIAAAGYFFVVPAVQINQAKQNAAKQTEVADKMQRVFDTFKRGAFTNPDSKSITDQADVQVGRDAVKDARAALDADAPALTKFSARPLLGWNKKYKRATDLDTKEEAYVKQSRAFLNDYQTLLDYTDKSAAIGVKLEDTTTALDNLDSQITIDGLTNALNDAIGKMQPLINEYAALTPPSYLKANEVSSVKDVNDLFATLKDLLAGVKALDVDKITKTSDDMQTEIKNGDNLDKDYIKALENSPVQAQINSLRASSDTIAAGYRQL